MTQIAPLSSATLHILISLAGGEKHGYAILLEVAQQSEGAIKLGPGTLYGNLKRLAENDWIRENLTLEDKEDPRRRYYAITPKGGAALAKELDRLSQILALAARKNLNPAVIGS